MSLFARYRQSHQKDDLDKSILYYTEAIILLHTQAEPFLNVVETLFHLTLTLLERSENFKEPEGLKYSIEYLRHLRRFPLDSFDVPRSTVTTSLIRALSTQVRLNTGNGTQDIKEMVVLCKELLSSNKSDDVPTQVPTATFSYLSEAVTHADLTRDFPTEMLDEIIACFRGAVKVCLSGSHAVIYSLAYTLGIRFMQTHSKGDYEEATVLLERILEPGGCPDSFRAIPSSLAITLAHGRSVFFQEPEYSEVAISRLRAASSSPSLDERLRLAFASSLVAQTGIRFREYSLDENLQEGNSYTSQLVNASSSSSLAESAELLTWSEAVRETYSATEIQQKIGAS